MNTTNRAVATGVAVLAALGVGSVLEDHLPVAQDVLDRPYQHHAAMDEEVTLRNLRVVADEYLAGPKVASYDEPVGTTGRFFMVVVRYEATSKPASPIPTLVAADGRRYDIQGPVASPCFLSQVGLEKTCRVLFEVPVDALPGATLELAASDSSGDDVAVIDLGIDQARADELAAAKTTLSTEGS